MFINSKTIRSSPTNKFNRSILNLLLSQETTKLTLLILLGFGIDKNYKMLPMKTINKNSIKYVYDVVNQGKALDYIDISETERRRDFTKNQIEKELHRMIDSKVIYLDVKKKIYVTDLFESSKDFTYVYEKFWFLFFNGSSLTRRAILFILDQMTNSQKQSVYFSQTQLLHWTKDNTDLRSITGTGYSKTINELNRPNGLLNFSPKDKYSIEYEVNPDYACVAMTREQFQFKNHSSLNLIEIDNGTVVVF